MRYAHTVTQVRAAEAPLLAGLPEGALMQRAVAGLAAHAAGRLGRVYGARVVVLAGGGDNGGDALWAGARLAARGARVDALAPGRAHPAGAAALRRAGGRLRTVGPVPAPGGAGREATDRDPTGLEGAAALLARADLVLDGLLGIGGRGALREPAAALAALADPAVTVAVDVPSGVDADTGAVAGAAVRASSTVTFGTYKRGLLLAPGAGHAGQVELVDIGLTLPGPDLTALDDADVAARYPRPVDDDSKYTRGVLGLAVGSDAYPGAAVLAVGGALRGGAGYLRVATPAGAAAAVRAAHPEAVVTAVEASGAEPGRPDDVLGVGRVQAWAVGSGLVPDAATAALVAAVLATETAVVLDAGALGALAAGGASGPAAALRARAGTTLLTPHDGEFARLVTAVLGWSDADVAAGLRADRLGLARAAAAELGATVLLKGSRTIVAEPGGAARVNTTGVPALATAGTGDVLTGLAGSLLAAGLGALDAGSVAAHVHGLAARRAGAPLAAADLLTALPATVAGLLAIPLPPD